MASSSNPPIVFDFAVWARVMHHLVSDYKRGPKKCVDIRQENFGNVMVGCHRQTHFQLHHAVSAREQDSTLGSVQTVLTNHGRQLWGKQSSNLIPKASPKFQVDRVYCGTETRDDYLLSPLFLWILIKQGVVRLRNVSFGKHPLH